MKPRLVLVLAAVIMAACIVEATALGEEGEEWAIAEIMGRILDLEKRVVALEEYASPRAQLRRELEREGYIVLEGREPGINTTLRFALIYESPPWKDFLKQADLRSSGKVIYYHKDVFYFEYTTTRSPSGNSPRTVRIALLSAME